MEHPSDSLEKYPDLNICVGDSVARILTSGGGNLCTVESFSENGKFVLLKDLAMAGTIISKAIERFHRASPNSAVKWIVDDKI